MRRRFSSTVCPLIAVAALFLTSLTDAGETKPVNVFAPDAGHLWNRVYNVLPAVARFGVVGQPGEKEKPGATALLAEFVKEGAPVPDTMTPLQRALMQRHLIIHFVAAVEHRNPGTTVSKTDAEYSAALARAIRKIALTAEEIRRLPDNYAAAVALPDAVTAYDPQKPAAFLPKDLLADDGPWIGLALTPKGGRQGVAAEFHFQLYKGGTSFEVRMRHPEGRAAGEAYLKTLAEMPDPYVKPAAAEGGNAVASALARLNPKTPQFPPGTAWALVHRAILADTGGRPEVSPLVEAVQIRVYRTVSLNDVWNAAEFKAEVAALEAQKKEFDYTRLGAERFLTAFEWTMRGAEQNLGNRGFHLSAANDTFFGAQERSDYPVTQVCFSCHSAPGIQSVNTRSGTFHQRTMARPPEFQSATREKIDEVTTQAARKEAVWKYLEAEWGK